MLARISSDKDFNFCKHVPFWGAAIAQWIRLRLPSSPKLAIYAFVICTKFVTWKEQK